MAVKFYKITQKNIQYEGFFNWKVVFACDISGTMYITSKSKKGKVFPYLLPSVGPGADSGVQAVSRQVM